MLCLPWYWLVPLWLASLALATLLLGAVWGWLVSRLQVNAAWRPPED